MSKVRMEEMSWKEVEEAIRKGKNTVIVPVGSIEQHGPHLPEGTDTFIGEVLGERIARILGNALVAPAIRPGCSQHHMDFPGTITIKPETLMKIVKEICICLAKHGFKTIVLLPTHGGNFAPITAVLPEISSELKDVRIVALTDLKEFIDKMNEVMVKYGASIKEAGSHAGASETSIMLALNEKLVRMDLAEKGFMGKYTRTKLYSLGLKAISPNGIIGDPGKASKKAGKAIIESLAQHFASKIKEEIKAC